MCCSVLVSQSGSGNDTISGNTVDLIGKYKEDKDCAALRHQKHLAWAQDEEDYCSVVQRPLFR